MTVSVVDGFDLVIALAYMLIPLEIAWFARGFFQRHGWIPSVLLTAVLFTSFIVGCGLTHLFTMVHLKTAALASKIATAVVSIVTCGALLWVMPRLVQLPATLEHENHLRLFNQTIVLCTRPLDIDRTMMMAADAMGFIFPDARVRVIQRQQLLTEANGRTSSRHGLRGAASLAFLDPSVTPFSAGQTVPASAAMALLGVPAAAAPAGTAGRRATDSEHSDAVVVINDKYAIMLDSMTQTNNAPFFREAARQLASLHFMHDIVSSVRPPTRLDPQPILEADEEGEGVH